MKLLKVSKKALHQYRDTVKGNRYVSDDQAAKKITRNVELVKETAPERIVKGFLKVIYQYGNLDIHVIGSTVVKIENRKGEPSKWKFPKERYVQLSEQLEIEDHKFKNSKKNIKKQLVNT